MPEPSSPLLTTASCSHFGIDLHALAWDRHLLHLTFDAATHERVGNHLRLRFPASRLCFSYRLQTEILQWFESFTQERRKKIPFPINPLLIESGTSFQQRVWREISRIPCGETRTYGQVAREVGGPRCARAVGLACHANPLVLIIPCHRVVAKTGLGGFNGGGDVKAKLLGLESGC